MPPYGPSMASSLLDRFGLGNDRAVANARQAAERCRVEDRLVAELVAALARHDARALSSRASSQLHDAA